MVATTKGQKMKKRLSKKEALRKFQREEKKTQRDNVLAYCRARYKNGRPCNAKGTLTDKFLCKSHLHSKDIYITLEELKERQLNAEKARHKQQQEKSAAIWAALKPPTKVIS